MLRCRSRHPFYLHTFLGAKGIHIVGVPLYMMVVLCVIHGTSYIGTCVDGVADKAQKKTKYLYRCISRFKPILCLVQTILSGTCSMY